MDRPGIPIKSQESMIIGETEPQFKALLTWESGQPGRGGTDSDATRQRRAGTRKQDQQDLNTFRDQYVPRSVCPDNGKNRQARAPDLANAQVRDCPRSKQYGCPQKPQSRPAACMANKIPRVRKIRSQHEAQAICWNIDPNASNGFTVRRKRNTRDPCVRLCKIGKSQNSVDNVPVGSIHLRTQVSRIPDNLNAIDIRKIDHLSRSKIRQKKRKSNYPQHFFSKRSFAGDHYLPSLLEIERHCPILTSSTR